MESDLIATIASRLLAAEMFRSTNLSDLFLKDSGVSLMTVKPQKIEQALTLARFLVEKSKG